MRRRETTSNHEEIRRVKSRDAVCIAGATCASVRMPLPTLSKEQLHEAELELKMALKAVQKAEARIATIKTVMATQGTGEPVSEESFKFKRLVKFFPRMRKDQCGSNRLRAAQSRKSKAQNAGVPWIWDSSCSTQHTAHAATAQDGMGKHKHVGSTAPLHPGALHDFVSNQTGGLDPEKAAARRGSEQSTTSSIVNNRHGSFLLPPPQGNVPMVRKSRYDSGQQTTQKQLDSTQEPQTQEQTCTVS